MGTYFHGNSEIQGGGGGGDGLQTLILMNPAYGYSEAQQPTPSSNNNFVFLNNGHAIHHAPPSGTQHFVGVPLQGTTSTTTTTTAQDPHAFLPRVPYNLYNLPMDLGAARDLTRAQQQSLSLSLNSQQPPGYASFRPERDAQAQPLASSPPRDDVRGSPSSASGVSNGVNGVQSVLLSSKYLKAAQELLDEVVNVGKGGKTSGADQSSKGNKNCGGESAAASGEAASGGDASGKRVAEMSTAERQEIQMKKAKLVNMLDEVEQRYRQYHHQMQIVISWFEQAAGIGSAKTYTALALQTISKQFRCLKDAILGQIRSASKSLGEEDGLEGKIEGSSRLKYVDNQLRQQRALQQLGMIQHNAWRPQRGLPERSVSVLRAWLFEHFLHPYPKDSDKLMLAKQTGLTRSQVSNWFINARVRLWKPMVEEMYTEEMKEHEKTGTEDNTHKVSKTEQPNNEDSPSKSPASHAKSPPSSDNQNRPFILKQDVNQMISMSTPSASPTNIGSGFDIIGSSEIESMTQASPKKLRMSDMLHPNMDSKDAEHAHAHDNMLMKFGDERQGRGGFTLMGAPTNFIGGFGSYPMGDLGRYGAEQFHAPYSGNGVSLTLGLPHCENMAISGAHQSFMPNQGMQLGRGVEIGETNDFNGMNDPTNAHSSNVYENINLQTRKRFAAQLLPDFVA